MPTTDVVVDSSPSNAAISGTEHATEVYGALCEGVHISSYTFERACTHLEWLLQEDR